ncbi:anti-sigma factor [Nocardioides acrostichi]|uniref:Zinc-finger n=1 Tax=Nocardioides acrostichi TaxID=2784339 RepID=A0A930V0E3_9ACTN|nr:zf-HC2 domain-containing protein [Nocardioides acrostichi]MBF4162370.1 hypothetical protein [Nocardioides acrostichi]
MIGHLGNRASALLDGALSAEESERLWQHVYGCHACRDLVEREGWIKTQLSGLGGAGSAPDHLKGALLGTSRGTPDERRPDPWGARRPRRANGLGAAAGMAGVAGAAFVGVMALSTSPAAAPTMDRRLPTTSVAVPTGTTSFPAIRRAVP